MSPKIEPFQKGDFIMSEGIIRYAGPIYFVNYPLKYDPTQELLDWEGLGFIVDSFNYSGVGDKFCINLLGDIPEWMQDKFKEAGIETKLHKERGVLVDCTHVTTPIGYQFEKYGVVAENK